MEEKKKQKWQSFYMKILTILSAFFIFQMNVEQVSAEELTSDFEEPGQTETVSESFEHSDDEFENAYTEGVQETPDEDNLEEITGESAEKEDTDSEGTEEETEVDSEDLLESEVEDSSETEEVDEMDTEEEVTDSEDVDSEERVDEDALEEEAKESNEEKTEKAPTSVEKKSSSKDKVEVDRVAGQNRYKNAVELSKAGWNTASTVILTNGEKFTDSLTGSPLASLHNAPILLTRADRLPAETLAEIKRLKAREIIVLGGNLSISNSVLETLRANGFTVRRIDGQNRYVLAENIAKEIMAKEGKNRDAFLVSGEVYSDAMSIASVAASKRLPIFLTRKNVLHQTVIDAIPYVNSWTIIGGELTINQKVQDEMNNLGAKTRRIDGRTRYDVNKNIINHYGSSSDQVYIASGEHFSDATPASVLAARKNSSVLLVKDNNKTNLKQARDFANKKNFNKLTMVGGPLTLSKETEDYFNNQNHVIYLDAGHGGTESGAVAPGVYEKDLNLSLSKRVHALLDAKGYTVMMSRTNDKTVSLSSRAQEANQANADIFVSIHHNSFNKTSHGIETYYYNENGKTNNPQANNKDRIQNSKVMAEQIQKELIKETGAYDRGVKRQNFHVLRETQMPAVLVEAGFIDNAAERAKLLLSSYQQKLASAISKGIESFFLA